MIVTSPPADADQVDGGPPEPDSATFANLGEPDPAGDGAMSSDGAGPAVSDGAGPGASDGACGAEADACCSMSSGQGACGSSFLPQCTGGACLCLAGCSGGIIELSDGTLWYGMTEYGQTPYGTTGAGMTELTTNGTTPFVALTSASSFSVFSEDFSQFAFGYGCAVQRAGTVACWGGNSYGALGDGIATQPSSIFPVQVLTAIGGPALKNITKVFVDHTTGLGACAVDASGDVWCWGDGYNGTLGDGLQSESSMATPVLQSGTTGAQFTGVATMSISSDHVCAVKMDGTIWCWGDNFYGQIGVGSTATKLYMNPVQVTALGALGVDVDVSGVASCAVLKDTSVWCWGSDANGVLGNKTVSGSDSPVQVLWQTGGSPILGATQVVLPSAGYSACALTSGAPNQLICWGIYLASSDAVPPPPSPPALYMDLNGNNYTFGIFALCRNTMNSSFPDFIDSTGALHEQGQVDSPAVTCPGLEGDAGP